MITRLIGALIEMIRKGLIYAVLSALLVWVLFFALSLYRYRFLGHVPDHILWLAPQHMPWDLALKKGAYIASVSAIVMFGFAASLVLVMDLLGWLIVGIALLARKTGRTPSGG